MNDFDAGVFGKGRPPRALVFDSGLGGLTVLAAITKACAGVDTLYVADDAAFPYGALDEAALLRRVEAVLAQFVAAFAPDIVVIACNTASTLALPALRAAYPALKFVGTVPAIKPAAQASQTKMISVLATPGTVARDYTHALVRDYAGDCDVALIGSARLASLAEDALRGTAVRDEDIAAELRPCFRERAGRRTDQIVLACTHFPLLIDELARLAPWPVVFVDPAPAIARRVEALLGWRPRGAGPVAAGRAVFTSGRAPSAKLQKMLLRYGLAATPATAIRPPGA